MSSADWSQGYVTDTTYVDKFFRELSPAWLNYVAALNGVRPRGLDRPFTYLELGSGFGTSAVVNAGAFPAGEFHACDFNPAHIEGGRRHAEAFGVGNIRFHEASFQDLLARALPPFDFIVLHGVYSWVGAEARRSIRDIIREKLKPGGLVYLSYNCLPGWALEVPLRKLLVELADTGGRDTPRRTERALRSLEQLSGGKLRYFEANPAASAAVESYVKGPSNYLAHEFLNQAWEPFYSVDVADELAEVGAAYVGSATLADNHPALVVSDAAAAAVSRLESPRQRQLAVDFAVNRRFRRDVFIRAGGPQGRTDDAHPLLEAAVGSLDNPARMGTKAQVPRGVITFREDFIRDLRGLMSQGSMTVGGVVAALGGARRDASEIVRNLTFLVAAGVLMPFSKVDRRGAAAGARRPASATVERALHHIVETGAQGAIPSEVLGNGVPVSPAEALAILEWSEGAATPEELAARLEEGIRRAGLKIELDGRELGSGAELTKHVRGVARNVVENLLPSLSRLGLIS